MEIVELTAPTKLGISMHFLKPFETRNTAEFVLEPQGTSTNVTWSMHGPSPFITKVMGVFVDMDTLIGKDFEKGLASLKSVAEQR